MTRDEILTVAKRIPFNIEMVKAIQEGRKTVTRRKMKPRPKMGAMGMWCWRDCRWMDGGIGFPASGIEDYAPYQTGDILYVQEAWSDDWCDHIIYEADGDSAKVVGYVAEPRWRFSAHMPKKAARLFLRVVEVRVERLQNITSDEAIDEGAGDPYDYQRPEWYEQREITGNYSIDAFAGLWDRTIKPTDLPRYGWDTNPWVWVVKFERIETS